VTKTVQRAQAPSVGAATNHTTAARQPTARSAAAGPQYVAYAAPSSTPFPPSLGSVSSGFVAPGLPANAPVAAATPALDDERGSGYGAQWQQLQQMQLAQQLQHMQYAQQLRQLQYAQEHHRQQLLQAQHAPWDGRWAVPALDAVRDAYPPPLYSAYGPSYGMPFNAGQYYQPPPAASAYGLPGGATGDGFLDARAHAGAAFAGLGRSMPPNGHGARFGGSDAYLTTVPRQPALAVDPRPAKRRKKFYICGTCGEQGHNKRTCKNKPAGQAGAGASDVAASNPSPAVAPAVSNGNGMGGDSKANAPATAAEGATTTEQGSSTAPAQVVDAQDGNHQRVRGESVATHDTALTKASAGSGDTASSKSNASPPGQGAASDASNGDAAHSGDEASSSGESDAPVAPGAPVLPRAVGGTPGAL